MSSLLFWPLSLGSPSWAAATSSRLASRLFFRERRAERSVLRPAGRGPVGVSAGRRMPLGYLMRCLPRNRERSPPIPAHHPRRLRPGCSVPGSLSPSGRVARSSRRARDPGRLRARKPRVLAPGGWLGWVTAPCAPSAGQAHLCAQPGGSNSALPACHPVLERFQQPRPQNMA